MFQCKEKTWDQGASTHTYWLKCGWFNLLTTQKDLRSNLNPDYGQRFPL